MDSYREISMKNSEKAWKYTGNVWEMIDNIQWTFVVERMMRDDHDRLMKIMDAPDKMAEAAEEYEMTTLAVAEEVVRLGQTALRMA